jgi:chromosome segregation ATPase
VQSMLLSKALKMQQDFEDKKHEVIIENLESKIKEQSDAIEKKNFELQATEGSLAEAEAKITELNTKLLRQTEQFERERQDLNAKLEAEAQQNSDLRKLLTSLQEKCLEFSNKCIQQLRKISTQLEPAVKNSPPQLKIYRRPSNILKVRLTSSTKS